MNKLSALIQKIFLPVIIFFIISLPGFSQPYIISGTVLDSITHELLPGASIIVEGRSEGTITDFKGGFELKIREEGKITLLVTYVSYKTRKLHCDIGKSDYSNMSIFLEPSTTALDEVKVFGNTQGQVKALLEQRTAVNIKNVISAEQIEQFPDLNAAEAMQRIPGITVQRDQGEGKYVQLRGTPPELTNFNVNGEQISSPEGNVRYVGMDIIAADQIEYIEVTKVLTPDMDADGIAGNVNVITKTAKKGSPEISATTAGGYNTLMNTGNYQLQFTYGNRYKNFGFQLNTSYYENNQGSHNMEFDYTRGPTLQQAQSGDSEIGAENFHILYTDIEYRHYTLTRKRTGLSANLDYKLNDNTTFYLRGMYNNFLDDETRRRKQHGLSDANEPLIYRSTGLDMDVRDRTKTQKISTLNLGAVHDLYGGFKLDYEASYSLASDEVPNYMSTEFGRGLIGVKVDKSDSEWPVVHYIDEEDSLNALNYGSYDFDGLTFRDNTVTDQNVSAKVNIQIPYFFNTSQNGYIKLGAKVRFKNKMRNNQAKVFSEYERINIYSQPATPLQLTTVTGDFEETNLLGRGYEIAMIPDADNMRDFYTEHMQHFKLDEQETWEDNYQEDYTAEENIYAAFLMFRHDVNKLMITGGVRFEKTDVIYTTQNAWLEMKIDSLRGMLRKEKRDANRTIPFVLPQVQLKYSLNQKTNIRAAATYTYSRPGFEDILPYRIENEDGNIKKGNPTLNFPTAINFDLLGETYLPNNGIISGGIFYKQIDDFVFKFVRRAHEGENFNRYGLREITMPVNGIEAFVYGAEIQTQFMFNFLDGFISNFGVFGTYTYTESDAYISKRYPQNENDVIYSFDDYGSEFFTSGAETEVIPLPGQAKHTANFALFYDANKIYIKISSNYHSPFLAELGNDSGLDVYYDEILHLDFTANYQVTKALNCFVDIMNLTDAPLRYYMGSKEYFKQVEYYSIWGRVGLKMKF
ncbi:MAG: TonB-dependent receptor [Bacteroidales bacterium]|nr:TonB-dependent receptor [Bacteroidales bacterium]MBN2819482.1 TonB-dependent receptor [Bacteroidales bacterium]